MGRFPGAAPALAAPDRQRPLVHVVVPEGLAAGPDPGRPPAGLSDYYAAVVQAVSRRAPAGADVLMAPGNAFGGPRTEERLAADAIAGLRGDLRIAVPPALPQRRYLDTFDNARLLRQWLLARGRWPMGHAVLYCNAPHAARCRLMFAMCGFDVRGVVACRPACLRGRIVRRLWYYHCPPAHVLYEAGAILYDLARWLAWDLAGRLAPAPDARATPHASR